MSVKIYIINLTEQCPGYYFLIEYKNVLSITYFDDLGAPGTVDFVSHD